MFLHIFSVFSHQNRNIMLVENKELITLATYLKDINKKHQPLMRYINRGVSLPGIEEYYRLGPRTYVMKKGVDYKSATSKVKKQKYTFSEK